MVIYKITNMVNGKVYVGQTVQPFETRLIQHRSCLRRGKHGNEHLQFAWNKYGEANFRFEAIDSGEHVFDLNNLEIYWINLFDSMNPHKGYNKQSGGYDRRVNSAETRLKISLANKGKKHTEEAKRRMSIQRMGNSYAKGNKLTEQTRKRMSESKSGSLNKANKKVINIVTGEVYYSARNASVELKINYSTLRGQLNGSYKNKTNLRYMESEHACA